METVHVNLYGGHGVGKSRIAAEVLDRLQVAGISAAAVSAARPRLSSGRFAESRSLAALADRIRRQAALDGKVEVVLCSRAPLMDVLDLPGALRWPALSLHKEMTRPWRGLSVMVDKLHSYSGHIDGWGSAGQANWRHERIREIAVAHDKQLMTCRHDLAVDEIVAAILARRGVQARVAPKRMPQLMGFGASGFALA